MQLLVLNLSQRMACTSTAVLKFICIRTTCGVGLGICLLSVVPSNSIAGDLQPTIDTLKTLMYKVQILSNN